MKNKLGHDGTTVGGGTGLAQWHGWSGGEEEDLIENTTMDNYLFFISFFHFF